MRRPLKSPLLLMAPAWPLYKKTMQPIALEDIPARYVHADGRSVVPCLFFFFFLIFISFIVYSFCLFSTALSTVSGKSSSGRHWKQCGGVFFKLLVQI
jgi:hypothetical protein